MVINFAEHTWSVRPVGPARSFPVVSSSVSAFASDRFPFAVDRAGLDALGT